MLVWGDMDGTWPIIKLVRHGQSEANADKNFKNTMVDSKIHLTELGRQQAREAGQQIGVGFIQNSLLYRSPYYRARETMDELLRGANIEKYPIFEDPRLREVDHGYENIQAQEEMQKKHGYFFYRFNGGESPADCYDRVSTFLESLKRQYKRYKYNYDNVIIVSHGLTIRCFVMRFLHLTVEDFESMANPENGAIITITHKHLTEQPVFTSGQWGVTGIKLRDN